MNERIKELFLKAEFRSIGNDNQTKEEFFGKFIPMFAELIVQECMSTVLKESKWYWDKDEFESSNAIQNAARRVKEHFGVEE